MRYLFRKSDSGFHFIFRSIPSLQGSATPADPCDLVAWQCVSVVKAAYTEPSVQVLVWWVAGALSDKCQLSQGTLGPKKENG